MHNKLGTTSTGHFLRGACFRIPSAWKLGDGKAERSKERSKAATATATAT